MVSLQMGSREASSGARLLVLALSQRRDCLSPFQSHPSHLRLLPDWSTKQRFRGLGRKAHHLVALPSYAQEQRKLFAVSVMNLCPSSVMMASWCLAHSCWPESKKSGSFALMATREERGAEGQLEHPCQHLYGHTHEVHSHSPYSISCSAACSNPSPRAPFRGQL